MTIFDCVFDCSTNWNQYVQMRNKGNLVALPVCIHRNSENQFKSEEKLWVSFRWKKKDNIQTHAQKYIQLKNA